MAKFRPEMTLNNERTVFATYRELKREMKKQIQPGQSAHVSRSLRREWGERFEYWSLVNGKLKIIKEGWM